MEFSIDRELLISEIENLKKTKSFRSSIVNEDIPVCVGGLFGYVNISRVSNSCEIAYLIQLKLDNHEGFCGHCLAGIMKYQRSEELGVVRCGRGVKEIPMSVSFSPKAWWTSEQEKKCPICIINHGESIVSLELPTSLEICIDARVFRDDVGNASRIKTFEDAGLFEKFMKSIENRLDSLLIKTRGILEKTKLEISEDEKRRQDFDLSRPAFASRV